MKEIMKIFLNAEEAYGNFCFIENTNEKGN